MMMSAYTSGIYKSYAGANGLTTCFSDELPKMVHQLFKDSFQLPFKEVKAGCLSGAKFLGEHSPPAACLDDVHYDIYYLP
jgi:hypothetical protein